METLKKYLLGKFGLKYTYWLGGVFPNFILLTIFTYSKNELFLLINCLYSIVWLIPFYLSANSYQGIKLWKYLSYIIAIISFITTIASINLIANKIKSKKEMEKRELESNEAIEMIKASIQPDVDLKSIVTQSILDGKSPKKLKEIVKYKKIPISDIDDFIDWVKQENYRVSIFFNQANNDEEIIKLVKEYKIQKY